ncbi:hypothetical protein CROQUDRAFT_45859, partial [Cronartium quercuum f. sp. fusiforme G11]
DTFLLASTGYRKSWIPELYLLMYPKGSWPIVLVVDPLDALGDNQFKEKIMQDFTAINLTCQNCTKHVSPDTANKDY